MYRNQFTILQYHYIIVLSIFCFSKVILPKVTPFGKTIFYFFFILYPNRHTYELTSFLKNSKLQYIVSTFAYFFISKLALLLIERG